MDRVIRVAAGTTLLIAAGLKARDAIDGFPVELLGSYVLFCLVITIELGFGVLLVSASSSRRLHNVFALLFAAMSAYAAIRWLRGYESCGCFGRVAVSPLIMALFDATIAAELWILRPKRAEAMAGPVRWSAIVGASIACAISLAVVRPALSPDGIESVGSREFILMPQRWAGRPFPLLNRVQGVPMADLSIGRWHVVLVSSDCGECMRKVSTWRKASESGTDRYALLDISGRGIAGERSTSSYRVGSLDSRERYHVRTPSELVLVDSIVKEIR